MLGILKRYRCTAAVVCIGRILLIPGLTILFFAIPVMVSAQTGSVQGRIRDQQGVTVEGVSVTARAAVEGSILGVAATDKLGFFRLDGLPEGLTFFDIYRLGFASQKKEVLVRSGQIETIYIQLVVEALEVEGITVGADRPLSDIAFDAEAGMTVRAIDAAQLKNLPGLIEPDPLRAAEVLPGVITTSDFSSAFNVRGGSADQNLILLDGLPVFNPGHLGGLVSIFNPDMIDRAVLRSGGFPAEYGGRVSSVLEIDTDPGDGTFHVDAGLSLLNGRVAVGGGLPEGTKDFLGLRDAKWRVSGRRSYFDILFSPFVDVPYHLNDAQAVFEAWTNGGDRLSFTAYSGGDLLDLTSIDSKDFPLRIDWNWGNDLVGMRWTHLRPGGGVLDLRAGYTRFSTGLGFPDFADTKFSSMTSQATVALDWEHHPVSGIVSKVGIEAKRLSSHNSFSSGGTEFPGGGSEIGRGVSGYAQVDWRPSQLWIIEMGARLDGWYPRGWNKKEDNNLDRVIEISPRISAKRFMANGVVALKMSVGRFTQFIHSIRDEDLPIGIDFWVLTGSQVPHIVSDQAQVGIEVNAGSGWLFSAEGYLRNFDGVSTFNFANDTNNDFDDYVAGRGRSYGVDFFARRSRGNTTGWLTVGWLHAMRTFPDPISGLDPAPEVSYPPIFDRRWDVDLVLSRTFGDRVEVGLRWNLGTGLPFTKPMGVYPYLTPQMTSNKLEWDADLDNGNDSGFGGRDLGVIIGPRNGSRYPIRHRLDMSVRMSFDKSWGAIIPYANIINVYNQKNVLFYFFQYDKSPPRRNGFSMFPILPTIGVEVKF